MHMNKIKKLAFRLKIKFVPSSEVLPSSVLQPWNLQADWPATHATFHCQHVAGTRTFRWQHNIAFWITFNNTESLQMRCARQTNKTLFLSKFKTMFTHSVLPADHEINDWFGWPSSLSIVDFADVLACGNCSLVTTRDHIVDVAGLHPYSLQQCLSRFAGLNLETL